MILHLKVDLLSLHARQFSRQHEFFLGLDRFLCHARYDVSVGRHLELGQRNGNLLFGDAEKPADVDGGDAGLV